MESQQHRTAAKRKRGGVHPKARRVMRMVYPEARRGEQVDEYFGTAVADPYRWMEELDAPETTAWIAAENAVTQEYMRGLPKQAELRARMEALSDYERFSLPQRFGSRFFYSRNSGLQNQPVLYWTEGLEGEPNVLFDPNAEAADGTVALAGLSVSEDGAVAALALAEAGSDWKVVRFRVVATGEELPDVIRWTKFSTPSWLKDGSGFFYSGYEAPPDGDPLKALNHFAKVYFHAMGTPQSEDRLVFERADDPEMFLHAGVSDDGRYLFVHQSRGTSPNNELGVLDLGISGNNVTGGVRELVGVADASYSPIATIGTKLLLQTTLDAPNGRVVQMDMDAPARGRVGTAYCGEAFEAGECLAGASDPDCGLSAGRAHGGGTVPRRRELCANAGAARCGIGGWIWWAARGYRNVLQLHGLCVTGCDVPVGHADV